MGGNSGLLFTLPGASRGPNLKKKTNRVAKTQALESDRSGNASLPLPAVNFGVSVHMLEPQSSHLKMG